MKFLATIVSEDKARVIEHESAYDARDVLVREIEEKLPAGEQVLVIGTGHNARAVISRIA